jgi:hypothetical protein
MSSVPPNDDEKLVSLFKTWEVVQDLKSLDRQVCQRLLEFFEDKQNTSEVLENPVNLSRFCDNFNIQDRKPFSLGVLFERKSNELRSRLQEFVPSIEVDLPSALENATEDSQKALQSYESLHNRYDYDHFISLFDKIDQTKQEFTPCVFICASSGTGKTQLAFSLPRNLIYFIMDEENPGQPVYEPFVSISEALQYFISNDLRPKVKVPFSDRNQPTLSTSGNENSNLADQIESPAEENSKVPATSEKKLKKIKYSDSSESGTFIMYLIEKFHNDKPSNWLEYELTSKVAIKDLAIKSIKELRDRLDFLIPKRKDRPLIFFDECTGKACLKKIYHIRTVLRMIGLIGVFMGTNADACEILTRSGSSRGSSDSNLFGYVVHKLPSMNKDRMSCMKKRLVDLISGSGLEEHVKIIKEKQIDIFFNVLKNEKPLFNIYAAEYLEDFFCLSDSKTINLEELCTAIREKFIEVKKITEPHLGLEFLKSQINLMMQNQWKLEEKDQYKAVAINRHIASLHCPSDIFLTDFQKENNPGVYFPIWTSETKTLHYPVKTQSPEKASTVSSLKATEKRTIVSSSDRGISKCEYTPVSKMPYFSQEPLVSLALSGALDDNKTFFDIEKSKMIQLSALSAFQTYILNVTSTSPSKDLNGKKLEYLGAMASVLSSRYATGCFFKFVERFAHHLTLENVEWKLETSNLTPKCALFIDKFFVPLLAPISGSWNPNLKSLLQGYLQEKINWNSETSSFPIGTCKFVRNDQQYDLSIRNGSRVEVIAMEFKLHKTPLTTYHLKSILGKLRRNSYASIAFVVSLDFVSSIIKNVSWKDIPQNNYIYSVLPKESEKNKLTLVRHFPAQDPDDHSFEMNSNPDVQMSSTDSSQDSADENEEYFPEEPESKKKRPDSNPERNLILILISLADLNRMKSTEEFLKKIPLFKGGL